LSRLPASISFVSSLLLASAFFLSRYCLRFTRRIERRWHALSAGVVVAYVFVSIMPELEEHRPKVAGSAIGTLLDTGKRIYIWALAGFTAFTGLGRLRSAPSDSPRKAAQLYSGSMAGYTLYALLMGYLLVLREDSSLVSLGLYVLALGLHLFIMDGDLAEQFEHRYQPGGRAFLACSVLIGWALGIAGAFSDSVTSRLFAFLAGGVLITSAHAEVRAEESTRLWWFVGGAAAYATVLMLI